MLSFNFNTLDGKTQWGGGKNGVAFEDQYHVRPQQFAK